MPPLDHEQGICAPTFILFCRYLSKRETFYNPTNYKLTFSQQRSPHRQKQAEPRPREAAGCRWDFWFFKFGNNHIYWEDGLVVSEKALQVHGEQAGQQNGSQTHHFPVLRPRQSGAGGAEEEAENLHV